MARREAMLDTPTRVPAPYLLFTVDEAFSMERCRELEALFDGDLPWARHDDQFYECFIADVTDNLDRAWLRALARRMVEHTSLDLTDRVQVTVQRMEPGDHLDTHSDRPLLGYEAARLVVQLDSDWTAEDGGLFRAFDADTPILERSPQHNAATGFALTAASLHEVTSTRRTRRSVVFNFWHAGNTEAVKGLVLGLFTDMSFGTPPDAVAKVADVAEAERPETDTHRAATVAFALNAWGYDADEAAAGYRQALTDPAPPASELDVATALARWLARLHVEDFDLERWKTLHRQLVRLGPGQHPRIREAWRVAFGRGMGRTMLELPCPHCGAVRYLDVNTGPDELKGTFASEKEAAQHSIMSNNTLAFDCPDCSTTSWAAFVDRRW